MVKSTRSNNNKRLVNSERAGSVKSSDIHYSVNLGLDKQVWSTWRVLLFKVLLKKLVTTIIIQEKRVSGRPAVSNEYAIMATRFVIVLCPLSTVQAEYGDHFFPTKEFVFAVDDVVRLMTFCLYHLPSKLVILLSIWWTTKVLSVAFTSRHWLHLFWGLWNWR